MDDDLPSRTRRARRALLLLVPAAAFVGLLSYGLATAVGPPSVGDPAPAFEAPRLDGRGTLALADFEGTPVVLNFWASWCVPCEDEAPMLRAAAERYRGRAAFIGVNIRDGVSDARVFVAEHELTYPNVRDESLEIYRDYGLTGQPETFFISADGVIVAHIPGALPTREFLLRLVEKTLHHG